MIRYKTGLNLNSKTFKFMPGLNTLIPFDYEKSNKLLSEMIHYFSDDFIQKQKNMSLYVLQSLNDFEVLEDRITNTLDEGKSSILIINGLSANFMFMSCAQKLELRIKLIRLMKQFNDMYVLFFTDDYSFISHTRSILIEDSRTVRNFKSYNAYYNFVLKGALEDTDTSDLEVCVSS